jgi:choline/carnitine/betaine transport
MGHIKDERDAASKRRLAQKLIKAEETTRARAIQDRKPFKGLQIKPTASYFDSAGMREPGEGNWIGYGFDLNPQVTVASVIFLTLFIALTLIFKEEAAIFFSKSLKSISANTGWFLILSANVIVVVAFYFAFSKFGRIKLGGNEALPEFSTPAWLAMLLSAGMGIGLMFWSVGEPITHYGAPSPMFEGVQPFTPDAAQAALGLTFFHWGIHPWAIYGMVGLGLAFFSFNRGLPLTIRSIFYPLLGNKIYGFWGHLIDVLSVLATLAGLATSLGLGVQQVNAGLNVLFGLEINPYVQVFLILGITGIATLSVFSGLDAGVKMLSGLNMILASLFMLFLLLVGPTVYILSGFTQNLGYYLSMLPKLSFWTETFRGTHWQGGWTVFYWAWWIAWSPFVGMFIARISRGRTVREFLMGVIIVPSLLSFIWMSVFGGSAIFLQSSGKADLAAAVESNVATALFSMVEYFPFSTAINIVAIVLVIVFFVTSSDSGSLVVDHLTSGGKMDSPVPQRVFWAIMEGILASILLVGGGLETLQTATICTGLPFAIIILVSIYSLYLGLAQEIFVEEAVEKTLKRVEQKHFMDEAINEIDSDKESGR